MLLSDHGMSFEIRPGTSIKGYGTAARKGWSLDCFIRESIEKVLGNWDKDLWSICAQVTGQKQTVGISVLNLPVLVLILSVSNTRLVTQGTDQCWELASTSRFLTVRMKENHLEII